ncbi:GGDEF domain-containing protein [Planobispora longispora]|uniref:GGDEF domain-containing protein n=2 Tax=Planobispora longispora TaxID=28887 RepID=A0A8J3W7H7_9ACTN|nr:GGDEF domain-containing protein [Planobispora longispora]
MLFLLFALSAVVATVVAVVGRRRRSTASAVGALAFLAAGIAGWSAADALLALIDDARIARVFQTVKFLAIGMVPAGLYCLSLAVADRRWRPSRRMAVLLGVEPALVLAAIATNLWHHGFFLAADNVDPHGVSTPEVGPLFWVHTAYSYLLLAAALVRLLHSWITGPPAQRSLYGAILAGASVPIAANVVSLAGLIPVTGLTSVGFSVTVVIIYWTLVHRSLPELVPVARERVFDMIDDAVATIDASGRILDLNTAAGQLLLRLAPGLPERLIGLPLADLLGGLPPADGGEIETALTDGSGRPVELNVRTSVLRDSRGGHAGWAILARDVTALNRQRRELEQANAQLLRQRTDLESANARLHDKQQQLEDSNAQLHRQLRTIELLRADLVEQATRDALTGLHNRRHLMEELRREMAGAAADGRPLSAALLDIDHFKQVNDRYGHRAGDEVLTWFAGLLGEGFRRDDVVARYGGEEFVVVFPGATAEQARARVETLRERVAGQEVRADEHELRVTFSAGVAAVMPGQSPDDLLQAADEALYAAKRGGRNQTRVAAGPQPETSHRAA